MEQPALLSSKTSPFPGDGQVLAWRSSNENIDSCIGPILELGHVAEIGNFGIVMFENGARKLLDLGYERAAPAERVPRHAGRFNVRTYRSKDHAALMGMVTAAIIALSPKTVLPVVGVYQRAGDRHDSNFRRRARPTSSIPPPP